MFASLCIWSFMAFVNCVIAALDLALDSKELYIYLEYEGIEV